jgi:hypothetical protein
VLSSFERYAVRPDPQGYSVFDAMTGDTVVIAMTPQGGLSEADARHTAEMLNHRDRNGDRWVHTNVR